MCGAAGSLDQEDRDSDRGKVLSRDGTSANLLASRLKYISLQAEPDLVIHMNDESVTAGTCTTLYICNHFRISDYV